MTITITKEDIRLGRASQSDSGWALCRECPIARGIRRIFPNATVGLTSVTLEDKAVPIRLPKAVRDFIQSFDEHQDLSPFVFDLNVKL